MLSVLLLTFAWQAETPAPPKPRLEWSAEERMRVESYDGLRFRAGNEDRWLLNRTRLNLGWRPFSWLKLSAQGQDSRVLYKLVDSGKQPFVNRVDLRLAYLDLALPGDNWDLRVGRQELIYGEERLLGAANWGNTGRSFDAAKLVWRRGSWQWDFLAASPVLPLSHGFSHHRQGNNLYAAYGSWKNPWGGAVLEPYWMYRTGGVGEALRGITGQHRWVAGLRLAGQQGHWRYSVENVKQGGRSEMAGAWERVAATASHERLGYRWDEVRGKPELIAEYNYASGDRHAADGRNGTFDQMFPTPHDKYGLADQVGWQNIHHWSGGVEVHPHKSWTVRCLAHDWRLAQAADGLYAASGALLLRDPEGKSGRNVGRELDLVAMYTHGKAFAGFGYGRLFAGEFLRRTTPGASLNYLFLNTGYRFR